MVWDGAWMEHSFMICYGEDSLIEAEHGNNEWI